MGPNVPKNPILEFFIDDRTYEPAEELILRFTCGLVIVHPINKDYLFLSLTSSAERLDLLVSDIGVQTDRFK